MTADPSRPLFILGMHRSGTSILASVLGDLGVFLGEDLIGAEVGNPRGHFEDRALYEFHIRHLRAASDPLWHHFEDGTLRDQPFHFAPTEDDRAEAVRLLEQRRRPGWWGWKEPRTLLFLDFWRQYLPAAPALLIYRHPLEVGLSHLRRALNRELLFRPDLPLRSYTLYNRAGLADRAAHPGCSLVVGAHAAFSQPALLDGCLRTFLGLPEAAGAVRSRYQSGEFADLGLTPAAHRLFAVFFPAEAATFDELQAASALPEPFAAVTDSAREARLDQLADLLAPLVADWPENLRARALGWVEGLGAGPLAAAAAEDGRLRLARTVAGKFNEYFDWAERSLAEQGRYIAHQEEMLKVLHAEKETLGASFVAEIEKTRKIWDELVSVGHDWHRKVDLITRLEQERDALRAERDALAARLAGPESPISRTPVSPP